MQSQGMNGQGYSTGGPVQPLHYNPPTPAGLSTRPSSGAWTPHDDQILMQARAQGMNWQPIQATYFSSKTPNACRKRHERLMDRRNSDDWDQIKLETLAKEYINMRKDIWSPLAAKTGEKWAVVEAKCMQSGLKNLQSHARACTRRERLDSGSGASAHNGLSLQQGPYTSHVHTGLPSPYTPREQMDGAYYGHHTGSSSSHLGGGPSTQYGAYAHNHHHVDGDSAVDVDDLEAEYGSGASTGSRTSAYGHASPGEGDADSASAQHVNYSGHGHHRGRSSLGGGGGTVSAYPGLPMPSGGNKGYDPRGGGVVYAAASDGRGMGPGYPQQQMQFARLPSIDMGIGAIINRGNQL